MINFRLTVNNFQRDASNAQLDLTGDSAESIQLTKQMQKWDRKKKKMITVNPVSIKNILKNPLNTCFF